MMKANRRMLHNDGSMKAEEVSREWHQLANDSMMKGEEVSREWVQLANDSMMKGEEVGRVCETGHVHPLKRLSNSFEWSSEPSGNSPPC